MKSLDFFNNRRLGAIRLNSKERELILITLTFTFFNGYMVKYVSPL